MARAVHLLIGGMSVACGAESTWRTRGKEYTHLATTLDNTEVTCRKCRQSWRFYRGAA